MTHPLANPDRSCLGTVALALVLSALAPGLAGSARAANPKLTVPVGQSITHYMASPVKTIAIANSDIADVVLANPHEILLNGKAIGFTTLVVWDDSTSTTFDVVVRMPFSDQQIELRVKIAELNRTKAAEYGFDFLASDASRTLGIYGGKVETPSIPLQIFSDQPAASGVEGAFRYFRGGDDLSAMVHMLQEQGILRVLAQPNVVAASGQNADFLSGGEIPVPVASGSVQGGSTVTIEWKEFGVGIGFVPTIVDSGVINLKVAPEVSSLDFANGIVLSGFRIPALRTRKAETTVELKDGEVLVIGGLMMEEETDNVRRIPLLGHIPLLGMLFSDTQKSTTQSELLFVVSAHIIRALPRGTPVDLPGVEEKG
jgi:pilus assembly protein CpaC